MPLYHRYKNLWTVLAAKPKNRGKRRTNDSERGGGCLSDRQRKKESRFRQRPIRK
ncbi:hypothetical protein HMPREF0262_00590 [Clostridium sp. ATCC 29733]|nr:hypothetical protein HMPREF0262_00590 [Clostridium sp. ATCC 29733]